MGDNRRTFREYGVTFTWTQHGEWLAQVLDDGDVVDAFVGPAMVAFDELLENNGWSRSGGLARTGFGQRTKAVRRDECHACGNVTYGEVTA